MQTDDQKKRKRTHRHLIGIAIWAGLCVFAVIGVQVTLGSAIAALAGFGFAFTLGWFAEHGADLFD